MYKFIIKRLLQLIPVIIGVTFIVFFIMSLAPSDITAMIAPDATDAEREELRDSLRGIRADNAAVRDSAASGIPLR